MGFFDTEEGVDQYEKMADGYDGRDLVGRLRRHLVPGATVLELGMGPGKDLDLLSEHFEAVGSDASEVFLSRYRKRNGVAKVLQLDAVSIATELRFDAIYSNKVLHHLTREELARSFQRQCQILRPGGIAMHSFWYGTGPDEEHEGLRFTYYTQDALRAQLPPELKVVETQRYEEMAADDSFVVVLQRA